MFFKVIKRTLDGAHEPTISQQLNTFTFPIWYCATVLNPLISLHSACKMENGCSDVLKDLQIKMEMQQVRQKRVCGIFISFKPACWFFTTRHDVQHKIYILCIFLFTDDHFSFSIVKYLAYNSADGNKVSH